MSFDKNKPHGVIYGLDENGARYIQDGVYYDSQGEEVGRAPPPGPTKIKAGKGKAPVTARASGKASLPGASVIEEENRKAIVAEGLAE